MEAVIQCAPSAFPAELEKLKAKVREAKVSKLDMPCWFRFKVKHIQHDGEFHYVSYHADAGDSNSEW